MLRTSLTTLLVLALVPSSSSAYEGDGIIEPDENETAELARSIHADFPSEVQTVVYVRRGEVFLRSRAAALAMAEVPYPAKALSWFRFLPAWLTDFFYGIVARVRYRVFGKYEHCPVPPERHRARFLP